MRCTYRINLSDEDFLLLVNKRFVHIEFDEDTTFEITLHDVVETCTRSLPHICGVNGACNGWPKETA